MLQQLSTQACYNDETRLHIHVTSNDGKSLHSAGDKCLCLMYARLDSLESRSTRSSIFFYVTQTLLIHLSTSNVHSRIDYWCVTTVCKRMPSDLPYDIRACDSVNVFERKLKTHLFNMARYKFYIVLYCPYTQMLERRGVCPGRRVS